MRKRRRMSRRLRKPEEREEGGGQGHTDSLKLRAMSLLLFGEIKDNKRAASFAARRTKKRGERNCTKGS